ncbi:hypothetical protein EST62_09700 [Chlorobaculum sp. 24CR]|uniref:LptE family protein n=1 Tax=Chlorobaculum sp. 24CR TaxID=2508878 RepID=UPI00100B2BB1|nr:LptE family protein [Chlorobaculum sp. 24CR]RXK84318.1 hypothetical protein EST62_09700 [Chlorobaculum sp. 24CR]
MRKTTGTLFALLTLVTLILQGCYSFSGGTLPPHLRTVAVPLFDDSTQAGISEFREGITRSLINKIESQSTLSIEADPSRADSVLNGSIVSYSDEPSQLGSATERAVTNRVTIVLEADFDDQVKNNKLFSQTFVGFADYQAGNYTAQQDAIKSAYSMAVDDLFNQMISNW